MLGKACQPRLGAMVVAWGRASCRVWNLLRAPLLLGRFILGTATETHCTSDEDFTTARAAIRFRRGHGTTVNGGGTERERSG